MPLIVLVCMLAAMSAPSIAHAGTYTMRQCMGEGEGVAEGWSVFTGTTLASAELQDHCDETEPLLGTYVFSEGHPGWVTQAGNGGSTVGLTLKVPGSVPGVSIEALSAHVIVSPVTGDDAFIRFTAGAELAGGSMVADGGGAFNTTREWTLPEGAREWGVSVYCSTDHSSSTCAFSEPDRVPAVNEVALTLRDDTPPVLNGVAGGLAEAAATHATIEGTRTLTVEAEDSGAGVQNIGLVLTPEAEGEPPVTQQDSLVEQCTEGSWHACPIKQSATFTLNTASLEEEGVYQVAVTATDAAGNRQVKQLGSIRVAGAPTIEEPPAPILTPPPAPPPSPAPAPTTTPEPPACKIVLRKAAAHHHARHHRHHHHGRRHHHGHAHHRKHHQHHARKHGTTMTRSWSHSALRLTGVTLGGTGTPTGGLPIVLSETRGLPASQGGRRELAHTTSGPHGEWTLRAAAGGSRRLQVQCGKSTVTVAEHVKPTLTMRAHGAPEGVLRFAGKLAGPHAPVRGTVMVQVHGPHGWQEVGNPVHPHHDHWHLTYHTSPRLAGYKFRFRAVSPSTPWTGRTVSHARRLRIR